MKKTLIIILILTVGYASAQKHRQCGFDEKLHIKLEKDASFKKSYLALEEHSIKSHLKNSNQKSTESGIVITIPVVVHIIFKNAAQNISDAQINSQIAILNNDFRKLNSDFTTVVPSVFQPFGADLEVQFVLAKRTIDNQPTNGIVRKSVNSSFDFDVEYYTASGSPSWDTTKYMNIWVGRLTDEDVLGFAYGPENAGQSDDGIVIGDEYFGSTGTVLAPYNKGRTTTHEVGHYFNLRHIWGILGGSSGSSCGVGSNSDLVSDTPATNGPYDGCPIFPESTKLCTTTTNGAMFMNYMDYTDDACMALFTTGQKTRVRAAIDGPRSSLKTSQGGIALGLERFELVKLIKIYPNPSVNFLSILSPNIVINEAEIYNSLGQKIKKVSNLNSEITINVSDLSAGLYFVKLYSNKELLKTERLIKL